MTWFRNIEADRFYIKTILNVFFVFVMYMLLGNLSWSKSVSELINPNNPDAVLLPVKCLELVTQTFVFYFALKFYITKVLKKEMGYFRITTKGIKAKWLFAGLLAPTMLMSIYLLFFKGSFEKGTLNILTGISLTFLHGGLKAGITEEILFRGFYMKLFESKWNRAAATILNSFLFAFIHLGNGVNLGSAEIALMLLSYTAAGVTFSIVTYKEKSTGSAVFMHAFWNIIAESNILCIVVSQNQYDLNAIFNYRLHTENTILTGGFFGISASIFAVFAFLSPLVFIVLEKLKVKYANP